MKDIIWCNPSSLLLEVDRHSLFDHENYFVLGGLLKNMPTWISALFAFHLAIVCLYMFFSVFHHFQPFFVGRFSCSHWRSSSSHYTVSYSDHPMSTFNFDFVDISKAQFVGKELPNLYSPVVFPFAHHLLLYDYSSAFLHPMIVIMFPDS